MLLLCRFDVLFVMGEHNSAEVTSIHLNCLAWVAILTRYKLPSLCLGGKVMYQYVLLSLGCVLLLNRVSRPMEFSWTLKIPRWPS